MDLPVSVYWPCTYFCPVGSGVVSFGLLAFGRREGHIFLNLRVAGGVLKQ